MMNSFHDWAYTFTNWKDTFVYKVRFFCNLIEYQVKYNQIYYRLRLAYSLFLGDILGSYLDYYF